MAATIINGVTVATFYDGSVLMSEGERSGTLTNEEREELIAALADVPESEFPEPEDRVVSVEVLAFPTLCVETDGYSVNIYTEKAQGSWVDGEEPWLYTLDVGEARDLRDALDAVIMKIEVGQ